MDIHNRRGKQELRKIRNSCRKLFWSVGLFSFFANLLMMAGPLYMLQVYDRVLSSKSVATLVALSGLVLFMYTIMGLLDYVRGRILARIGARFQAKLDARVFSAALRKTSLDPQARPSTGLRDLEAVQKLLASPALTAMFDIPWTPIFLAGIWIFHPYLGMLALAGGALLVTLSILNTMMTRATLNNSNIATVKADYLAEQMRLESELIRALGMQAQALKRWKTSRDMALDESMLSSDMGGAFSTISKTLRLMLQSAMLGMGAYLVLGNNLSPGAMIAGSILLGRALAPIESAIGQWPLIQRAATGWRDLAGLLGEIAPDQDRMDLPQPKAFLEVKQATIIPPGDHQAVLRMLNFAIKPGQACGVIGPSGAGKSTLARALTGIWEPAGGAIRLDGAALANYDPDVLGRHIGYLPQRVYLFDGTIAENIARLTSDPDPTKVHEAAKRAGAYDMILQLPDGFDTRISNNDGRLSGGQIQRIGLARALYGNPPLLVLDEPNSNLDNDGNAALNQTIRAYKAKGHAILIMAHRPAAIQECDILLMIENGTKKAFGPKEQVLRDVVQNAHQIVGKSKRAGVA